jgi:hypothetical protein
LAEGSDVPLAAVSRCSSSTGKNYPFPDDYIPPKELPPPKEEIVLVDRQI